MVRENVDYTGMVSNLFYSNGDKIYLTEIKPDQLFNKQNSCSNKLFKVTLSDINYA
jgi:hypothetical protein